MTHSANRSLVSLASTCVLAVALMGCAQHKDEMTTASIGTDYKKTHPILVAEENRKLHLVVTSADRVLTFADKLRVQEFGRQFLSSGRGILKTHVPVNAPNSAGVERILPKILHALKSTGIGRGQISVTNYETKDPSQPAVIHLSYVTLQASVGECGIWEHDLAKTDFNKHYGNLGCATQANLAAQIADPKDLISPRAQDPINAEQRGNVINVYRDGPNQAPQYAAQK